MQIFSTYSILPLASCIIVFALGFFIWLKKPKEWLHILFFLYNIVISIWLFGTFMLFNAVTDANKIFWDRFIYSGVIFIPVFLYHFGLLYCNILNRQRVTLIIGYLFSFVFLPLSQFSNLFVSGLYTYSWGVHTIARTYHHLFLVYFFFYFILFFVNLFHHYKVSSGNHKIQVKYLLIGYAILDAIGPLAFLPAYGIPVYPVVFLSAIPFAFILAYAIIRYKALDTQVIAAEVVAVWLNLLALSQIFFPKSGPEMVMRILVFIGVFVFSIILVRLVKKEIIQREKMVQANLILKELDRQKDELFLIAGHQFRTPLSIIKGYIDLLADGTYGKMSKKVLSVLSDIDQNNERLIQLVSQLLLIINLDQGKEKYIFEEIDFNKLIIEAVELNKIKAINSGIKIKIVSMPEPNLVLVQADREKITQVISVLLENAVSYSSDGTIKVYIEGKDMGISVRVVDQGIGFDPIDAANFFQKFHRGNNASVINVNYGSGLNLYIVRKLIEAHGGKVWAHSAGKEKGSEFGFWIPL